MDSFVHAVRVETLLYAFVVQGRVVVGHCFWLKTISPVSLVGLQSLCMTIKSEATPNTVTVRVPPGTARVVIMYEQARPAVVMELVEIVRIPMYQCRAVRAVGERCRRSTWTAVLNEVQLCSCHLLWLQEGRSVMAQDGSWPAAGRSHGLEVPAVMGQSAAVVRSASR